MKKAICTLAILAAGVFLWQVAIGENPAPTAVSKSLVAEQMQLHSLAFTENQGQWDDRVLFRANAGGAVMWFTQDGAYYQFTRRVDQTARDVVGGQALPASHALIQQPGRSGALPRTEKVGHDLLGRDGSIVTPQDVVTYDSRLSPRLVGHDLLGRDDEQYQYESIMIKASFVGANPNPEIVGQDLMEYKCNYFIGNDPDNWHTNVPNYRAVVFKDIYAGIDIKYYGAGDQPERPDWSGMEYDLIVSPGADPSQIQFCYEGVESISTNASGELVIETGWGELTERIPFAYQGIGGCELTAIECKYRLMPDNGVSFRVSESYDPTLALIIDPALIYSTYLGGESVERTEAIVVDAAGRACIIGYTKSTDFPVENPIQDTLTNYPYQDLFVTKFNSAGTDLVFSTYLGGTDDDYSCDAAISDAGDIYLTGRTGSPDFPTTENAFQVDVPNTFSNAFVTKLSATGDELIYSTYLGGGDLDIGWGIAVDGSGNAYVTGYTSSSDFPTLNPCQTDQAGLDVFVSKLNSNGNGLLYSTYLGGGGGDLGYGIAVDGSGNAYVTGYTQSSDFPTENPYQMDQGGHDVFVTKLSSSGDSLIYSTYLGGGNCDCGFGIAVDGSGNAYVTGETWSSDFPTENPYQGSFQGGYTDVFVTKIGDFVDAADDDETEDLVPDGFSLYQNYPNPFNPSTVVEYSLKRSANVSFEVYNVLGQKVRHYDLGRQMYGSHRLTWDGYDNNGKLVSSGVYFYRLKAGDYTETKKMLLLR